MYVITGGGTGIGAALAIALAQKGESSLIIGRRETYLKKIAAFSSLIQYQVADISLTENLPVIQAALEDRALKALIHNAGTILPIASIQNVSIDEWEKQIKLNLFTPLHLSRALLAQLTGGKILHIGSAAAYFPIEGWSAYCVSKAGLAMLTKCMQIEISQLAVSSVMPGIVETDMTAIIRQSTAMNPENLAFHTRLYQEGRLIQPETVAQFLTWLLMEVDNKTFKSQEWDIYEKSHHPEWLKEPYSVPEW